MLAHFSRDANLLDLLAVPESAAVDTRLACAPPPPEQDAFRKVSSLNKIAPLLLHGSLFSKRMGVAQIRPVIKFSRRHNAYFDKKTMWTQLVLLRSESH